MREDTPPPEDETFPEEIPVDMDDIEIIDDADFEFVEFTAPDNFINESFEDDAKLTFAGHTGSVFCCALDKNGDMVVSGAQDDKGIIWNPKTGETIFEILDSKDSVFAAGFSRDSKYVAIADMAGLVQAVKIEDKSPVFTYDVGEDLRFLEWNPMCNVLFVGAAEGTCWMWHVTSKQASNQAKVFQGFGSPTSFGKIMPSGHTAVVGYDDGSIRLWDLKSSTVQHAITGEFAPKGPVTTIDCHSDNVLILAGSTDGTAKVVKATEGKVLFTLRCEPEDLDPNSVEGANFFVNEPLIATGTICGNLAIWDVPTQVRRLQFDQQAGITKLICDPIRPVVYTAGVDGVARLVDGRTGQLEKTWSGHTSAILDFALSSDQTMLVTSSDDGTCKIFDVRS